MPPSPTLVDPRLAHERDQVLVLPDETRLYGRLWLAKNARGTVHIVHGLGEHIGRYLHVAQALNDAGWNAVGFDQRGHGASNGARGAAPVDALAGDLAYAIDRVREGMTRPLVVLGHSMGGALASDVVVRGLAELDGLVVSSPPYAVAMTPSQKRTLAIGNALAPSATTANGLDPLKISRDPLVVSRYVSDPFVHAKISPSIATSIIDAGARAIAAAPHWPVPTLLVYGGADGIVDVSGADRFAAAANRALVTSKRYDGLYHEIFNEPEHQDVLRDVVAWLDRTFPRNAP